MVKLIEDIKFKYFASTNVGIGDDGVNAFPISHSCETRLAEYVSEFIFNLIIKAVKNRNLLNILNICINEVGVFNIIESSNIINIFDSKDIPEIKIDIPTLILVDLESGFINNKEKDFGKILNLVNEESLIFVAVSRHAIEEKKEKIGSIRNTIQNHGLSIEAFLKLEPGRFQSLMTEQTESFSDKPTHFYGFYILVISRNKNEYVFAARLKEQDDAEDIIGELFSSPCNDVSTNTSTKFSNNYAWKKSGQFYCWELHEKQIEYETTIKLLKNYKFYTLKELYSSDPVSVLGKDIKLDITNNSIFIQKNVNEIFYYPFIKFENVEDKEQEYLQINLNQDIVLSDYIIQYFLSDIGETALLLAANSYSSLIDYIDFYKDNLDNISVAIPSIGDQRFITTEIAKFEKMKIKLAELSSMKMQSIFYSDFNHETGDKINRILDIFDSLSENEKLLNLISSGESKTLEFKQTLTLDIKNNSKAKYIEDAAIKTIAAFLNSNGGILLIGVNDEGVISGVDSEIEKFFKSTDKILLHLKSLILNRIGAEFYPFIDQRSLIVHGKTVIIVECKESTSEVYVDEKDFYVRTNPATDKLEGPKLVGYIKNRFK